MFRVSSSGGTQQAFKTCAECGKTDEKLKRCGRCKSEWYCNVTCQKKAWPKHKQVCQIQIKTEKPMGEVSFLNRSVFSFRDSMIVNQEPNFNYETQQCISNSTLIKIGFVAIGIFMIYVMGGINRLSILAVGLGLAVRVYRYMQQHRNNNITSEITIQSQRTEVQNRQISSYDSIQFGSIDLDIEKNFPKFPGSHTILSPIVGTRYLELCAVKAKMHTHSIIRDLETAIYHSQMVYLIPLDKKDEADKIARPIFLEYISKYSSEGITEDNIVEWLNDEDKGDPIIRNKTFIYDVVNKWNTWRVQIFVMSRVGKANEKFDRYLPPHIAAFHEVMHAEETPKQANKFYQREAGTELLTTIKTFILLDIVYKRIYNLTADTDVDYRKNIILRGKSIPLGKFANFYRTLEQKYGALYKALISLESISFLSD